MLTDWEFECACEAALDYELEERARRRRRLGEQSTATLCLIAHRLVSADDLQEFLESGLHEPTQKEWLDLVCDHDLEEAVIAFEALPSDAVSRLGILATT
jgi:hypothetical protein